MKQLRNKSTGVVFNVLKDAADWVLLEPDTPEAKIANLSFTLSRDTVTAQYEEVKE